MSAAKAVSATFTGGSAQKVLLKLAVSGTGTVRGAGIVCSKGTCSADVAAGSTITLAAVAGAGSHFAGWGGACTGTKASCTIVVRGAASVAARFAKGTGGGAKPPPANVLRALGRPVVVGSGSLFHVTLAFQTARAGTAAITAARAGRVVTSFALGIGSGGATIGPFPVRKPGFYSLRVALGGAALEWHACLGRCGAAAPKSAGPFVLQRADPVIRRSGRNWLFAVRFSSNREALAVVRVRRPGTKPFRQVAFAAPAGANAPKPLVLAPGSYVVSLIATDAFGRTRDLAWSVVLGS
jgi:hypothetical protein